MSTTNTSIVILAVYVDDILMTRSDETDIQAKPQRLTYNSTSIYETLGLHDTFWDQIQL